MIPRTILINIIQPIGSRKLRIIAIKIVTMANAIHGRCLIAIILPNRLEVFVSSLFFIFIVTIMVFSTR